MTSALGHAAILAWRMVTLEPAPSFSIAWAGHVACGARRGSGPSAGRSLDRGAGDRPLARPLPNDGVRVCDHPRLRALRTPVAALAPRRRRAASEAVGEGLQTLARRGLKTPTYVRIDTSRRPCYPHLARQRRATSRSILRENDPDVSGTSPPYCGRSAEEPELPRAVRPRRGGERMPGDRRGRWQGRPSGTDR